MKNIPAFPSHGSMGEVTQEGMTLRDYFAAHAPVEPPWYFEVRMPHKRPELEFPKDGTGFEDPTNLREIVNWDDEESRQRYIQWPWVYADAMLSERDKP